MVMMKKIKITHLWSLEHTEQWLEKMELDGYRLVKVKFGLIYYFKKTNIKSTRYIFTYQSPRGTTMSNLDYSLLTKYSANEIKTIFSSLALYRIICNSNLDLLIQMRSSIISKLLVERLITSLFLFSIAITGMLIELAFGALLAILILPFLLYYSIGLTIHFRNTRNK